jgi:hypothetical protein
MIRSKLLTLAFGVEEEIGKVSVEKVLMHSDSADWDL